MRAWQQTFLWVLFELVTQELPHSLSCISLLLGHVICSCYIAYASSIQRILQHYIYIILLKNYDYGIPPMSIDKGRLENIR